MSPANRGRLDKSSSFLIYLQIHAHLSSAQSLTSYNRILFVSRRGVRKRQGDSRQPSINKKNETPSNSSFLFNFTKMSFSKIFSNVGINVIGLYDLTLYFYPYQAFLLGKSSHASRQLGRLTYRSIYYRATPIASHFFGV